MPVLCVYEVRSRGAILSTGTLLLEALPQRGETIQLGGLSGTVNQVIVSAVETRLVVEVNEPKQST